MATRSTKVDSARPAAVGRWLYTRLTWMCRTRRTHMDAPMNTTGIRQYTASSSVQANESFST
ncbi:hypothetical protein D3C72_2466230 [compost metagenome]